MPTLPRYRLRLFLSVDLVGSTAFKALFGDDREGDEPNPRWVTQIRHFYREFPNFVSHRYEKAVGARDDHEIYADLCPSTWKTVGDEILFCCRLKSLDHLAVCATAFLGALDDYGSYLDGIGKHLDVKGAGWVAAFPAPNVTVAMLGRELPGSASDLIDEELELKADRMPGGFDFLGKEIDSGFRSARNAAADRFTASLELAWLLTDAANADIFSGKFSYHGRQILKGVIRDYPYPIVTLESERSALRREVLALERAITQERNAEALHLKNFLAAFMKEANIDAPLLPRSGREIDPAHLPRCYRDFEKAWRATAEENEQRAAGEKEAAAAADNGHETEIPNALNEALDKTVAQVEAGDLAAKHTTHAKP